MLRKAVRIISDPFTLFEGLRRLADILQLLEPTLDGLFQVLGETFDELRALLCDGLDLVSNVINIQTAEDLRGLPIDAPFSERPELGGILVPFIRRLSRALSPEPEGPAGINPIALALLGREVIIFAEADHVPISEQGIGRKMLPEFFLGFGSSFPCQTLERLSLDEFGELHRAGRRLIELRLRHIYAERLICLIRGKFFAQVLRARAALEHELLAGRRVAHERGASRAAQGFDGLEAFD